MTATSYASIRQGFADWYSGFSHLLSHEFIDIEQSILSMMPLIEVEEALEKAEEGNKWSALLQMWKDRSEALCETYGLTTNYEISLAARSSCLKVMIGHSASPSSTLSSASSSTASMEDCKYQNILSTSFQDHLLKYCKLTRKSGLLHFSGKAIEEYSRLASSSLDSLQADLQRAKLLWKKEEWSEALGALKAISIKAAAGGIKLEGRHGAALKAKLLLQLAIWSGETRTENPDSIIAFYFDAQRESQLGDVRLLARTHYHLARYCDDQYQSMLNDESNSSIARQLLAQKEEELKICMKVGRFEGNESYPIFLIPFSLNR